MLGPESETELELLLEAIYSKYHHDFRHYARASVRRRLQQAMTSLSCPTLSRLQDRVLHDASFFPQLLRYLTVPVSEMFRDPLYFKTLREKVIPTLRTYPSLKVWVAGCSTGEEVYSLAILLQEEGLLARSLIYATDINPDSLRQAEAGMYALDRMARFTELHQQSGSKGSLSAHYTAAYGFAAFDKALRANVVFSDHSLATDSVFTEVHLISCRNVLIYFDRELQERAVGLFQESLCRRGFLGLGIKESIKFIRAGNSFSEFAREARIYQRY